MDANEPASDLDRRESDRIEQLADEQGFLVIPDMGAAATKPEFNATNDPQRFVEVQGYTILQQTGCGGSSVVFRAVSNKAPQKMVAIKVFRESALVKESLIRFNREIQSLKKLQHPNIAGLIDYGIADNVHPYIVLEFIDGERIDQYCKNLQLSHNDRIRLLISVCRVVQYAHDRGVLHRDLKPGNILVDAEGNPHLTDFGLARFLTADEPGNDRTRTGAILGTLNYLAPEQIFGSKTERPETTDVFGLGAVLYTLLTGSPPLQFSDFVDAARDYFKKLPATISSDHGVAGELESICIKCLSPESTRRYQSAEEVAIELKRFLSGNSVSARSQRFARRLSLLHLQYPWLGRTISGLVVAGLAASIVFFALWRSSEMSLKKADQSTQYLTQAMVEFSQLVRDQEDDPGTIEKRRDQLAIITKYYEKLNEELKRDPDLLYAAAVSEFKLGRLEHHLGNRNQQKIHYRRALGRFQLLVDMEPGHADARFSVFHCLMSLGELESALATIAQLNADFPGTEHYEAAVCSVSLLIAETQIVDKRWALASKYLDRGTMILKQYQDQDRKFDGYERKLIHAKEIESRLAIANHRLDDAQTLVGQAIDIFESTNPLESPVASESWGYLKCLKLACTIAEFQSDDEQLSATLNQTETFFESAQQRYPQFIELYSTQTEILADHATYQSILGNRQKVADILVEWERVLELWNENSVQNREYWIAQLEFLSFPFRDTLDIDGIDKAVQRIDLEGGGLGLTCGKALFRIARFEEARPLLESADHFSDVSEYAQVLKDPNFLRADESVEIPAPDRMTQLELLAQTLSYFRSQLGAVISKDLEHARRNSFQLEQQR